MCVLQRKTLIDLVKFFLYNDFVHRHTLRKVPHMSTFNPAFAQAAASTHSIGTIDANPEATFDEILDATKKNFNQGRSSRELANSLFARAHGIYTQRQAYFHHLKPTSITSTRINDTVTAYMSVASRKDMKQAQVELAQYVYEKLHSNPGTVLRIVFVIGYEAPTVFQLRYSLGFSNTIEYRVETWDFQRLASGKAFAIAKNSYLRAQEPVFSAMWQFLRNNSFSDRSVSYVR